MNAMPLKDKPLSRRGFIGLVVKASLAGTALFGLGALGRFLSYQSGSDQPAFFDLGPTTGFPIGSLSPAPTWVARSTPQRMASPARATAAAFIPMAACAMGQPPTPCPA
jgi:hypothetical protein